MRQIVLDTETTGLDIVNNHRIIEIAGVELMNRKLTKNSYQIYLNPERTVGQSFNIHGISDDFLSDKPFFKDVYKDFLEFIKDSELLIHNAEFDIGFLNYELKLANLDTKIEDHVNKITDTLSIAREKHPGQRNSLEVLTDRYQITGYDRSYHGALIDSEILADVYLAMTGGQRDLGFDDNSSKELQSKFSDEASNDFSLFEIKVSDEDTNKHENYLNSLRKDNHGNN
jgi:DNA polymerase III epsilon subunit